MSRETHGPRPFQELYDAWLAWQMKHHGPAMTLFAKIVGAGREQEEKRQEASKAAQTQAQ